MGHWNCITPGRAWSVGPAGNTGLFSIKSPCGIRWRSRLPGSECRRIAVELSKTGLFEMGKEFDTPVPPGVVPPEFEQVVLRRCRDCKTLLELHEFTPRCGDTVEIVEPFDSAEHKGRVGKLVSIDPTTDPWRCKVRGRGWVAVGRVVVVKGHGQSCVDCVRESIKGQRSQGDNRKCANSKRNRVVCGCGEVCRADKMRMLPNVGLACDRCAKQLTPKIQVQTEPVALPRPSFDRPRVGSPGPQRPSVSAAELADMRPAVSFF